MALEYHKHTGIDSPKVKLLDTDRSPSDVNTLLDESTSFFETVGSIPTDAPSNFLEQIKIYVSGGDILLYVYDTTNTTWRRFNYYTP